MYIVLIKAPNLLLKECYGLEKLGSNFLPAVQLGCIDQKVCILNLFLFPGVSEWLLFMWTIFFPAMSWQEHVTLRWDHDDVRLCS